MEIKLDSRFWDCECEHHYVRPREITFCPCCESHEDEMPDSRVDEVLTEFMEALNDLQERRADYNVINDTCLSLEQFIQWELNGSPRDDYSLSLYLAFIKGCP